MIRRCFSFLLSPILLAGVLIVPVGATAAEAAPSARPLLLPSVSSTAIAKPAGLADAASRAGATAVIDAGYGSLAVTRSVISPVPVPGRKWFVNGDEARAKGVSATAKKGDAERAIAIYVSAASEFFLASGFTAVRSPSPALVGYISKTMSCAVANYYSTTRKAEITCALLGTVRAAAKQVALLYRAVGASSKSGSYRYVLSPLVETRTGVKGYVGGYGYVSYPGSPVGGSAAVYYRSSQGPWMYLGSTQETFSCSTYEKSRAASRAWSGAPCLRGNADSTVRSR